MAKPVRHHWSWAVPKDEPLMERSGGGLSTALWMMIGAALIFIALVLIVPALPSGPLPTERPAVTNKPAATPPRTLPTHGSSGGGMSGTLPDCATVTDSRTACTGTVGEMPQGEQEEPPQGEQVQPTPTPPYLAGCLTPPGERPCWLPPDQAWEPPVSVPETPVVLVPEPPIVDVCAMWRPPLAYPEGCDE